MSGNKLSDENLISEVELLIRTAPDRHQLRSPRTETWAWLGRAKAVLQAWNPIEAAGADVVISGIQNSLAEVSHQAHMTLMTLLSQAQNDLRMRIGGPISMAIGHGMTFSYFDELRKIIELASVDLLFVDPYMNADFVSQYLPHAKSTVQVRLLGKQYMPALVSAADAFKKQHGAMVTVRSTADLHDRFVFVDSSACYFSGASFKDGPKNANTILSQVTDASSVLLASFEKLWSTAKIELQ